MKHDGLFGYRSLTYNLRYISETAISNLIGRVKYQWNKKWIGVCIGKHYSILSNGGLEINKKTQSRQKELKTLYETFPWIDMVDCEIFLLGFEAGYRFVNKDEPTDQLKRLRGSESLKRIWGNNADELLEKHIEISREVDRIISLEKDGPI